MATRLWSRIVCRGPILGRIPRVRRAGDGAASAAFINSADFKHVFLGGAFQLSNENLSSVRTNNHDHADPTVEGPRLFLWSDSASLLQQAKNCGQLPLVDIYGCMATIG